MSLYFVFNIISDYLSVETLVSLAISASRSFYEEFVKARKTGIFETMVRFNATGWSMLTRRKEST